MIRDTVIRYELMKKPTGKIHAFLYKLKIPFYILIGVLLVLQAITVSVAVTTWTSFQMDLLIIILYVILTILIMVFYLITGVRLLKHLKPNENKVDVNNNSKHLIQVNCSSPYIIINNLYRRPDCF